MRSREIIWKGKSLKHDRSISIRYTIFYTCTILFLRNIKTREASTFPYLYRRSISVEMEVLRSIKIRLELESRCQKDIYIYGKKLRKITSSIHPSQLIPSKYNNLLLLSDIDRICKNEARS